MDRPRNSLDFSVDWSSILLEGGEVEMSAECDGRDCGVCETEKKQECKETCHCSVSVKEVSGMGYRQEEHLARIKAQVVAAIDVKYRAGQAEHGGYLLDIGVSQLLDAAIDEAIDQATYLLSLKELLGGTRSERK